MKKLDYKIFKGKPKNYRSAAVDYDGILNFFDTVFIRHSYNAGGYRGGKILETIKNSGYECETSIKRNSALGKCPFDCEQWGECDRQDEGCGCGLHVHEEMNFKGV